MCDVFSEFGSSAVMERFLTEVQMKEGGARGHEQTVMKPICDLQLAEVPQQENNSLYCLFKSRTRLRLLDIQ
ncbi:hypothetical protein CgunFtcFv8_027672 [Champsocephalus gunnari]|uniref:Uncharacterized protein n=1 Tax=Champsocephalus gunnari TaxID=52237 RepID=A0AAN8I1N8_CHAGU|nr:hypothetical protein CgunFtcFv8_005779 [Champsocephalus gunnari]KAK5936201.1 hypothetical protein CgunFtcFv8_027672 [Champsocephalus gunnari]